MPTHEITLAPRSSRPLRQMADGMVGAPPLVIPGPIDRLFIFGERRQRLGDWAAGTIVVDE